MRVCEIAHESLTMHDGFLQAVEKLVLTGRLSARLGQELMSQGQWNDSERLLRVGIASLDGELVRTYSPVFVHSVIYDQLII
jgi:hypothetical protein